MREFLEEQTAKYNTPFFIANDPISLPHRYTSKADREVAGFLTATISWGKRELILAAAGKLLDRMGESPASFVQSFKRSDFKHFKTFVYRTFNAQDLLCFFKGMQHIYLQYGGPEPIFNQYATPVSLQPAIHHFRKHFFEISHTPRTEKHLADPLAGSAAKRINMWLRWMVRSDAQGVDFGLWKTIQPSQLSCPIDLHSGKVARDLGILQRNQNDAKAVAELDQALRYFDPNDPVKYDFALFGSGVSTKQP